MQFHLSLLTTSLLAVLAQGIAVDASSPSLEVASVHIEERAADSALAALVALDVASFGTAASAADKYKCQCTEHTGPDGKKSDPNLPATCCRNVGAKFDYSQKVCETNWVERGS